MDPDAEYLHSIRDKVVRHGNTF